MITGLSNLEGVANGGAFSICGFATAGAPTPQHDAKTPENA
ncbi:hypothetical protein [Rhizobium sp. 2MFCol3.1]|nr:hypothetical protein [Rhizobium sp. 2MFCol3.1]